VAHGALQIQPDRRWPTAAAMLDVIRTLLPDGWALREEMLVPVDDATRAMVALRAFDSAPTFAAAAASTPPSVARTLPPAPSLTPAPDRATSHSHVPASTATPPPRSLWPVRAAAGAAFVVGIALPGAYYLATSSARVRAHAAVAPSVTASAEPAIATSAPPAAPSIAVADVKLLVSAPRDATVEVDDAGATVREGAVEIHGAVGSVHHVRVFKGAAAASAEVVVTETGAVPPRVELAAGRATTPGGAKGAASAASPAASARPASKPLLPDTME
jgi:serine/threonine-protein kinase